MKPAFAVVLLLGTLRALALEAPVAPLPHDGSVAPRQGAPLPPREDTAPSEQPVQEGTQDGSPEAVARAFYAAFVVFNCDAMEPLYAPNVAFQDEVFEYQDRAGTMHMWRTLLGAKNGTLAYTFDRVEGEDAVGHWVADYELFGRSIHNEIGSRMTVKDGHIIRHRDSFSWSIWARQAFPLGPLVDAPGMQWMLTRVIRGGVD